MEALLVTLPHCTPCDELMEALGYNIPKDVKVVVGTPENYHILAENNAFIEINGELHVGAPLLVTKDGRRVGGVQKILEELKRE